MTWTKRLTGDISNPMPAAIASREEKSSIFASSIGKLLPPYVSRTYPLRLLSDVCYVGQSCRSLHLQPYCLHYLEDQFKGRRADLRCGCEKTL